jgi:hypothetical protein
MTLFEENVLRLDIPVHHVVAVRVIQRVGYLAGDLEGVLNRQLFLTIQPVTQRFALCEGHDVVEELGGSSSGRICG